MSANADPNAALHGILRALKLPSFAANHERMGIEMEQHGWTFGQALRRLAELELHDRRERRIARLLKSSGLPANKTRATLDLQKLPAKVRRQLPSLGEGGFLSRAENILLFGLPGRGKTHVAAAIGHELVHRGHPVLFTTTQRLVERLLIAKRDLELERELRRLDTYEAVILDDIGYVQQDRGQMEVLFTFLAQSYERKSIIITSNLVFSQWDQIFKDPMTTAAAIDRLVHHSVILEMTGKSIRTETAKEANITTPETENTPN